MKREMSQRKILNLIVPVLLILVIVGVGIFLFWKPEQPSQPEKPEEGITLRVATRHDSTITNLARELFLKSGLAKSYNISDVIFVGVPPSLWLDIIKAASDEGRPFDVAWGGGPTLFDDTLNAGLLKPIDRPETLAAISKINDTIGGAAMKRIKDGKIYWCAAAISSFGFIINYDVLRKYNLTAPGLWEDLASIEFAKILPIPSVSFASPSLSTSHTRIYEIILTKFGWDLGWTYLTRIAANGRSYPGSVEALTAVQSGEVPIGIAIDFYGYSSEIQFPSTKYVLPYNQSIVNGDPIALLTTTNRPTEAQAFIEWVLSTEGQKIWLDDRISRMPVLKDVFMTPEGKQKTQLYKYYNITVTNIGIPFDDNLVVQYEYAMRIYFDATLVDIHGDLVAAWSKLVNAFLSNKITQAEFEEYIKQLGEPLSWEMDGKKYTFTLEYAISINESLKDPATGSKMAKVWRDAARARYSSLMEKLP